MLSLIRSYFPDDYHTAVAVAKCESGLNQWGARGPIVSHTNDVGLFQINLAAHSHTADNMGLDVTNSITDNITYARYLYEAQGWAPWVCYNKLAQA